VIYQCAILYMQHGEGLYARVCYIRYAELLTKQKLPTTSG